jgi:hypothetical protein
MGSCRRKGRSFSSEAVPGSLPVGQNSPGAASLHSWSAAAPPAANNLRHRGPATNHFTSYNDELFSYQGLEPMVMCLHLLYHQPLWTSHHHHNQNHHLTTATPQTTKHITPLTDGTQMQPTNQKHESTTYSKTSPPL